MIVYIPTPITSVEQAEALPEGTIAKHSEYRTAAVKTDLCEEGIALWYDTDDGSQTATSLLGWTALVPVEAHTQDLAPIPCWGERERRHRHVTAWLPGPSRDRRGDCA